MREKVIEKLKKYNQEHLLEFENELSDTEKQELYSQILDLNFDYLYSLDENNEKTDIDISPIPSLKFTEIQDDIQRLTQIGLDALKNQDVAALLLAGGMGTRLGSSSPKGMYNIGKTKDVYIFQTHFETLLKVSSMAGKPVPFFIMTSEKNHEETVAFLEEKNYFGYDKNFVRFFTQEMAPCTSLGGKILLESKSRIATSPNGNGGWFNSLLSTPSAKQMLDDLQIKWLNIVGVDNVLQKIADPVFIGAVLDGNYFSGSKVVRKTEPQEKVGLMCMKNGKASVIEYIDMSDEMKELRNENGELAYGLGIVLNYLFNVDELYRIKDEKLPVHVVTKKVEYIDRDGNTIVPTEPNAHKFEYLCVDMIELCKSCLPYEVLRNREFAPIKNKEGVDSVATAQALLEENGYEL